MTRSVISGANLNPPVDTSTLSPTSFRLPTNAGLPSNPQSGQLYYDTAASETRIWDSNWKKLDTALALEATTLAFSSASRYTTGSHTGQDGLTRSNGRLTSPQISYSGGSLSTRLDSDYEHVLVVRYLANGSPYVGIGITIAPSITDAQAAVDPGNGGDYYGHQTPPHGASGATNYGMYFNQASGYPQYDQVGYFYFFTDGEGSSRTFQTRWSTLYSTDYKTVGAPSSGGSTGSLPWSKNITIGSNNDIALWFGEASNTNDWRIERYSRSI